MTIDIWMPSAVIAGIIASRFYVNGHSVSAGAIVVIPPILLSLDIVINRATAISTAAGLSAAWLIAAGAAGLPLLLLQRKKRRQS